LALRFAASPEARIVAQEMVDGWLTGATQAVAALARPSGFQSLLQGLHRLFEILDAEL